MKEIFKYNDYEEFYLWDSEEYQKYMKFILKECDTVCFSVEGFIDEIEEIKQSKWWMLADSVERIYIDEPILCGEKERSYKEQLVIIKRDYNVYQFFLELEGLYTFENDEDSWDELDKIGFRLKDPAFIKDNKVICYTYSHTNSCFIIMMQHSKGKYLQKQL